MPKTYLTPEMAPQITQDNRQSSTIQKQMHMLDLVLVLAKYKRHILVSTLVFAFGGMVVSLLLPNIYSAKTTILPPQQSQSTAAAMLGQLGSLANFAGKDFSIKDPSAQIIGILKSRTVSDRIIERFKLNDVYGSHYLSDTRATLADMTAINAGKDGIITIEVNDRDPKRAAALANAYPEELYNLSQNLAVTEASQRRLFFEKQLAQAKDQLSHAETELRSTQESTGLIQPESQAKAMIESVAILRGQMAAKEVQLSAMRSFATAQNPDLVRTEMELSELKAQMNRLENQASAGKGDIQVATQRVPAAGLEYLRKYRDVKYYETIYELLAKQFEIARFDEAKDAITVQVLDKALEPDKRIKPVRSMIVLLAATCGALLSILAVLIIELGWALLPPENTIRV